MEASDIDTYGGALVNRVAVQNAETDVDADDYNLVREHLAQMTRTIPIAEVEFTCVAAAAPQVVTASWWSTLWGRGVAQRPTINKTATGIYTVAFAATYLNGLGVSENVTFSAFDASAYTPSDVDEVFARRRLLSGQTATVLVQEFNAGAFAAADTATTSAELIRVTLRLYR